MCPILFKSPLGGLPERPRLTHFSPTSPGVSVLLCACDAEKTVRRAIESVQNQTFRNIEVIVVDAGSVDGTARLLDVISERDMRVAVEHVPACSRQAGLNRALDRARGEYLMVLDEDGYLEPTYIQKLLEAAERDSAELVVGGFSVEVCMGGRSFEVAPDDDIMVYRTQHDFRTNAWRHFASGRLSPAAGKLFERSIAEDEGCRFDEASATNHSFTIPYLRGIERVAFVDGGYRVNREFTYGADLASAEECFDGLVREHEAIRGLLCEWGLEGDTASMEMLQTRYLEVLALCVEAACACGKVSRSEEARTLVARMISDERTRLAASVARPRDGAAKALTGPVRSQNVKLAMAQARILSKLRRGAPATLTPDAFV